MQSNQSDSPQLDRWERIDGIIYDMTPSPSSEHQSIVGNLFREISGYLKGKTCRAYTAPYDVYLDNDEAGDYVQPDISVICDLSKIAHKGCIGTPDMVVEVLSPTTAKKDKSAKLKAYRGAGVREYWIVDPYNQFLEVYLFSNEGSVFPTVYNKEDTVRVSIFEEELEINLQDIFD